LGDGLGDSHQAHLEPALGQREVSQLLLHSPNEIKVRSGDVQQTGKLADSLDTFTGI
jgi:hypothetical protein